MLHFVPIFHTLLRRKLSVFLMVVQIAFAATIFSNVIFTSQKIVQKIARPSGIPEHLLFSVTMRPINPVTYSKIQYDLNSISEIHGVEHVASVRWIPLGGQASGGALRLDADKNSSVFVVQKADVSPQALVTLGLTVINGRDFSDADMSVEASEGEGPKSIIVSRSLAEALFGESQNAVGKIIFDGDISREIIGVTENSLGFTFPLAEPSEKTAFYPHFNEHDDEFRYLVRTKNSQDRGAITESVTQLLINNYQNQLVIYAENVDELKSNRTRGTGVTTNVLRVMMVALGLVVGFAICGQAFFGINQRIKQIGIYRALGASRKDIIFQLLMENIMICALGLIFGVALSLLVNKGIMQIMPGISPISPLYLLSTCAVLMIICIASTAVPAWRAGQISPSIATRSA